MISQLGNLCAKVFYHTCPDPFVIAILLSVLTYALALFFGHFPGAPADTPHWLLLFDAWRSESGIWKFLAFALQMSLILVSGHALAETRPMRRLIASIAALPRTAAQAAALVGLVACVTGVINWGLSLIVGALTAREVGRAMHRKGVRAHYPLLAAAGYFGLMVWHGGLSGSGPLSMTTRAGAEKVLPRSYVEQMAPHGISLDQTIFSSRNLILTGGLVIGVPLLLMLLTPRRPDEIRGIEHYRPEESFEPPALPPMAADSTIPERLDRSFVVALLLALPLIAAIARFVWTQGSADAGPLDRVAGGLMRIGLNEVNATMIAIGLILHGSVRSYLIAAEEGARGCAGILIQFPLFGGIIAMMESSGLVETIARFFATAGTAQTIPLMSFFAACLINFFVPSGGAQWAIQGPIALQTAAQVGITDVGKMVMTVAYGDQTTNMLQPFWALPLLSITGVRARDIVGYNAFVMIFAGIWLGLGLMIL